jgi:phospholipase/carboxylesterase
MIAMTESAERCMAQEFPLYYDLYVPVGAGARPLLIALHGYGGDKSSMMKLARRINDRDYVIAALQGPHQHMIIPPAGDREARRRGPGIGFGWLTNFKPEDSVALHHRAVSQIIDTLVSEGAADAGNIFLLCFSQAVGVSFRYAFTHPDRVRGLIAICGGIPGDWSVEGKYHSGALDVLYLGALRDEFYSPERIRENAEALRARARSVRLEFFDTPHEVPRESYPLIDAWIKERI